MCQVCDAAMLEIGGESAHPWDRADAAIKAWRQTLPDDVEFDGIMEECEAWAKHMRAE